LWPLELEGRRRGRSGCCDDSGLIGSCVRAWCIRDGVRFTGDTFSCWTVSTDDLDKAWTRGAPSSSGFTILSYRLSNDVSSASTIYRWYGYGYGGVGSGGMSRAAWIGLLCHPSTAGMNQVKRWSLVYACSTTGPQLLSAVRDECGRVDWDSLATGFLLVARCATPTLGRHAGSLIDGCRCGWSAEQLPATSRGRRRRRHRHGLVRP